MYCKWFLYESPFYEIKDSIMSLVSKKTVTGKRIIFLNLLLTWLSPVSLYQNAQAQSGARGPQRFNIVGTIYQPNGNLYAGLANLKFEVRNQAADCVLYEETHLGVDTTNSNGDYSIDLGLTGSRSNKIDNSANLTLAVFKNNVTLPVTGCGSVSLPINSSRKVRIYMDTGSGFAPMSPDLEIQSLPYAMIAESFDGRIVSDFILTGPANGNSGSQLTQANLESLLANATNLTNLTNAATGAIPASTITGTISSSNLPANIPAGALIGQPIASAPAPTSGQVLTYDGTKWLAQTDTTKLPLAGGTMTGAINMSAQNLLAAGHITMSPQKTLNFGTYTTAQETTLAGSLSSADKGKTWFNSQTNQMKYWDGTTVQIVGTGSGTVASVTGNSPITVDNTNPNAPVVGINLTAADIPNLDAAKITTGTFAPDRLGTGTAAAGKYLDGTGAWTTLPAGNTGTVTSVATGTGLTGGPITSSGTIAVDTGTTNGKIPVIGAGDKLPSSIIPATDLATSITGTLPITNGGTGATTAAGARTNLGLGTAATKDTGSAAGSVPVLGTGGLTANKLCTADGTAAGIICTSTIPTSSQWTTTGSDIYYNTGNVGIGTTTPSTLLHVKGASAVFRIDDTNGTNSSFYGAYLDYAQLSVNRNPATGAFTNPGKAAAQFAVSGTANNSNFLFYTSTTNNTMPTEKMRIEGNGNVGIGTTAPSEKLDVSTAIFSNVILGTNSANALKRLGIYYDTTNTKAVIDASSNKLSLQTVGTERMLIDNSGRVGIGTATPATKLDVVGSVKVGTDATACAAGIAGAIRYNSGNVEYCNGSAWTAFGTGTSLSGDVSGSYNATSVDKIKGTALSITALTSGNFLKYNGTNWVNAMIAASTDITGTLPIANGGTGATTAAGAITNLGLGTAATKDTGSASGNIPVLGTGGLTANKLCTADGTAAGIICTTTMPASVSQWTTTGSDIYYNTGKVAIGTTTPVFQFEIQTTTNKVLSATSSHTTSTAININNTSVGGHSINFFSTGSGNFPGQFGVYDATTAKSLLSLNGNNGGLGLGAYANATITNGAPANGIIVSGNVGIGTTSPTSLLHVGSATVTTGTAVANFQNIDGTCTITPAASGSGIACTSDETLKDNFQNVSGGWTLENLLKLQAYTYNFKTSPNARHTGYKAQEVQKIAPEFVRTDDNGKLQVYYDAFIPWITEAIKTVYHRVLDIESRQAAQDREIAAIKSENAQLKQENWKKMQELKAMKARLDNIERILTSK